MSVGQFILEKLGERKADNSLRILSDNHSLVDFCSNDYLGFAKSNIIESAIRDSSGSIGANLYGAGGSRLISGNYGLTEETEDMIANFHNAEAGLIFNSGYDANLGLLSSLCKRGDTVILDELSHASLIDGARLSNATRYKFKHNHVEELEAKLKVANGNVFVVVESVYSMDGDCSPLKAISSLCELYNANLIVDEAHAIGVFGDKGEGLVQQLGLCKSVFARIVTFGKALGCHGSVVLGSKDLRQYLINFARSFIYTTALPLHSILCISASYEELKVTGKVDKLRNNIALYRDLLAPGLLSIDSESAIQTILFKDNISTKVAANKLQSSGFDVRAILSPTVPVGQERLRICIHSFNSDSEIHQLVNEINLLK